MFPFEPQAAEKGPSLWAAREAGTSTRISFVFFNSEGTPSLEVRDMEMRVRGTRETRRPFKRCYSHIARWGENREAVPEPEIWSFPLQVARDISKLQAGYPLTQHDILLTVEQDPRGFRRHHVSALPDRWYPTLHRMPDEQEMLFFNDPSQWPFKYLLPDDRPRHQWDWFSACSVIQNGLDPRCQEYGCLVEVRTAENLRKARYLTRCNIWALVQNPQRWLSEEHRTVKVEFINDLVFQGWRID